MSDGNRVSVSKQDTEDCSLNTSEISQELSAEMTKLSLAGELFDPQNPKIKQEIISMIIQYLQNEGFANSVVALQEEANLKNNEQIFRQRHIQRMKSAILEGDWAEVERVCNKNIFSNYKSFLYSVYKQQYLEMIESGDLQKAFTFLTRRIKPLEHMQSNPNEFKDLCYLLTCKSVQEVDAFKHWEGVIGASRERLVEQFQTYLDLENANSVGGDGEDDQMNYQVQVPPNRLLQLIQQSVCFQVAQSKYHPKTAPKVASLLNDYSCFVVPNSLKQTLRGHRDNVKCVEFLGQNGLFLASGSSDNTIGIWDVDSGNKLFTLEGHRSRIWSLSCTKSGRYMASASGDSTVKIWDLECLYKRGGVIESVLSTASAHGTPTASDSTSSGNGASTTNTSSDSSSAAEKGLQHIQAPRCAHTLEGHVGDVYCVRFHQGENHIATGGYDKTVRLYDARTGVLVRTFTGHTSSVCSVTFNPYGNLIISGSKDNTIKFWDIVSGVCINTFSQHLGEVTSVEVGTLTSSANWLLSCSKDNSNRLWDLRTGKPIRRFKGHQNTYKNLIRASFDPNQSLIASGSEDGNVYIWDIETGNILQRLAGHSGIVYQTAWNARQGIMASCSDDCTVKLWHFDESKPR